MSLALSRAKADAESRLNEERKVVERRRAVVVLCASFFQELGYIGTVQAIQNDTNVSLDKIDAADNVDLNTIVTEYEDFYEMRFGRKPKLTRKVSGDADRRDSSTDRKISLPKIAAESTNPDVPSGRRKERCGRSKSQDAERRRDKPPAIPVSTDEGTRVADVGKNTISDGNVASVSKDGFEGVIGQNVSKLEVAGSKPEPKDQKDRLGQAGNDFYENQLLKALPTGGMDKEYRELAAGIQRDILTRNPGITWDGVVGLAHAKALLKEAVVMPLRYPQLFTGLLAPWKGVLLFGPPGTGKTLLAKAVATECETTFFNISASTVVSKWRGDSEKLVRVLFDLARYHQPSTIFIDELDSLMSARGGADSEHEGSRRMKTELLIQMDGLLRDTQDQVFLLAASNLPWDLDSAMLRRLEKRVLVDLPNAEAREAMIRTSLPEGFAENLNYSNLADLTVEWSGSDIRLLCKEAAMHPVRRLMVEIELVEVQAKSVPASDGKHSRRRAAEKGAEKVSDVAAIDDLKVGPVTNVDVEKALQTVHRAPAGHLDKYADWQTQFGAA